MIDVLSTSGESRESFIQVCKESVESHKSTIVKLQEFVDGPTIDAIDPDIRLDVEEAIYAAIGKRQADVAELQRYIDERE